MGLDLDVYFPWRVSGTYLEACNCEAICPCRTIGGRRGGRSTYGVCLGSLSWQIEEGRAGEVALAGMRAVLANRYHDDETGSPWRLGGTPELQFPWVWKPSTLLGVRHVAIEVDHTPGRGWFRAGGQVSVRVREPVAELETVTCVIPGHDRSGREVVADLLRVEDGALHFELSGKCGYEATFDYSSETT